MRCKSETRGCGKCGPARSASVLCRRSRACSVCRHCTRAAMREAATPGVPAAGRRRRWLRSTRPSQSLSHPGSLQAPGGACRQPTPWHWQCFFCHPAAGGCMHLAAAVEQTLHAQSVDLPRPARVVGGGTSAAARGVHQQSARRRCACVACARHAPCGSVAASAATRVLSAASFVPASSHPDHPCTAHASQQSGRPTS